MRGLVQLAEGVKLPHLVAEASRRLALSRDQLADLMRLLLDTRNGLAAVSSLVIADGAARFGNDWVDDVHAIVSEKNLTPERVAELFLALTESQKTWEIVRSFGVVVDDAYWMRKRALTVEGPAEDLLFAIDRYVTSGRPMAAIQVSLRRLGDVPSAHLMHLLASAISEINEATDAGATMSVYYIEKVFEELDTRPDIEDEELARLEFAYLPCFSHSERPLRLHRLMVQNANAYMDVISRVFMPASDEPKELSEAEMRQAAAAYNLLTGLRILPGQTGQNIDFRALNKWCAEVRELAEQMDLITITDQRIGHLLAHAPVGSADQAWPHEAVREVIERLASHEVELGVTIERFNMRGVYRKAVGEGGAQERVLALQARKWADAMPNFPRTAAMLIRISDDWTRYADDEDIRAEKENLRLP